MLKKRHMLPGIIAALALAGCLLALIPALLSRVSIREKETIGALYRKDPAAAEKLLLVIGEESASGDAALGEEAALRFGMTEQVYDYHSRSVFPEAFRILLPIAVSLLFLLLLSADLFLYQRENRRMERLSEAVSRDLSGECPFSAENTEKNSLSHAFQTLIRGILSAYHEKERYLSVREEEMKRYAENVAHQMKTPTAGLILNLELLKNREEKNAERDKTTETILANLFRAAEDLEQYVSRFLKLARLSAGKIHFHKEVLRLSDYLLEFRERLESRNLSAVFSEAPDTVLELDRNWMDEALENVVLNAASRSPEGRPVEIEAGLFEQNAVIRIRDEGAGLRASDAGRIFERYYTSDESGSSHGIGLSLAKEVITRHFGSITAKDRESGGAEFEILLPVTNLR